MKPTVYSSLLLIALGILLSANACKTISKRNKVQDDADLKSLVDSIAFDANISSRYAARIQTESPYYTRRHKLMREASTQQLIALIDHTSAIIRLTALEGLYRRNHPAIGQYFNTFRGNNETIGYILGDVYYQMPVLEFAYSYILGYRIDEEQPIYIDEPFEHYFELQEPEQKSIEAEISTYRNLRGR